MMWRNYIVFDLAAPFFAIHPSISIEFVFIAISSIISTISQGLTPCQPAYLPFHHRLNRHQQRNIIVSLWSRNWNWIGSWEWEIAAAGDGVGVTSSVHSNQSNTIVKGIWNEQEGGETKKWGYQPSIILFRLSTARAKLSECTSGGVGVVVDSRWATSLALIHPPGYYVSLWQWPWPGPCHNRRGKGNHKNTWHHVTNIFQLN